MNKITYLDGMRWYRALIAGIRHVISRQDHLNNINVFPVPDRDTGTNMALTLNAVIEATYASPKNNLSQLFSIIADSALSGARGNSGAIIAQFFQGMANGIDLHCKKMEPRHFARAVNAGMEHSYNALSQPKEGTILTIIKDFSTKITQSVERSRIDFVTLLQTGLEAANHSLQKTTKQLAELQKAQVVDAGAQGFVDLLQGIYNFIHHGSLEDVDNEPTVSVSKETISEEISLIVDDNHRYCTECLIEGEDIHSERLRQKLEPLGDCLVVAGSQKKTKVHIHTNNPAVVFALCREHGRLCDEKADDMIQQQRAINHKRNEVAILTDSGADLPQEIIADLDIHVVPLQLHLGKHSHIDKVTITPEEFYHLLRKGEDHPKTSQPSSGDFNRQYQYLSSHYHAIISIHLPRVLSGTLGASEQAAKKSGFENITVFDACAVSAAQGLLVQCAAEAAKAGKNKQDILDILSNARQNTHLYVALPDLSYLSRGGRLSAPKKNLLRFLRLVPIISLDAEGKVKILTCLWRRKNLSKRLSQLIAKKRCPNKTYRILVSHCDNAIEAEQLLQHIQKKIPKIESIRITRTGATLGAHGGPEAFGLALQAVD